MVRDSKCIHGLDERFCARCNRRPIQAEKQFSQSPAALAGDYDHSEPRVNVWWLGVDLNYTSYHELKARRVIAQGWPKLGDLKRYVGMAQHSSQRAEFEDSIAKLCVERYGADDGRAAKGLWRYFQIEAGDLVVAIEGTTVRGVTKAVAGAATGYWLDVRFHYAQCIGRDQNWVDWDYSRIARTPAAPAQGVLAAARVQNERAAVIAAWKQLNRSGTSI